MLGFFSKQPDHPLADAREARRVCAEISKRDPQGAVDESAAWLESVTTAEGFKLAARIERVLQLDEATAPQARRLGREFVSLERSNSQKESQLWKAAHAYWMELVAAYESLLLRFQTESKEESESAVTHRHLVFLRLIHARAVVLKLDQFRYGPIGNDFWQALGAIYLQAEADKLTQKSLPLYPAYAATTVEGEYLKALLFQASAMDNLLPVEIELAERLIAHFLPNFSLTREVRPENVYWVDAAKPAPPTRLARLPEITPSLRFFNGSAALTAIETLQGQIAADFRVPADVNLGGQYEPAVVKDVLEHLAQCWSPKPPMRKDTRHRVKSRLVVAHGMDDVMAYISGRKTDHSGVEAWVVDDVSLGGMGAQVPISRQDWISIGVLVAMQPEGGENWLLGSVRRFARLNSKQGQVGIETLSKTPVVVQADAGGLLTDAIVLDVPEVGEYARMALPPEALEDKVALTFTMNGKGARFHPREILVTGPDFVIANFFVQSYS